MSDHALRGIIEYAPPGGFARETLYSLDDALIAEMESYLRSIDDICASRALGDLECAIVASTFRDVRAWACANGLDRVSREAAYFERSFRHKMHRLRSSSASQLRSIAYSFWRTSSRYGTSVGHWLRFGASVVLAFGLLYWFDAMARLRPWDLTNWHAYLHLFVERVVASLEVFTILDYTSLPTPNVYLHLLKAIEGVLGLSFFGFGFSMLITSATIDPHPPQTILARRTSDE